MRCEQSLAVALLTIIDYYKKQSQAEYMNRDHLQTVRQVGYQALSSLDPLLYMCSFCVGPGAVQGVRVTI